MDKIGIRDAKIRISTTVSLELYQNARSHGIKWSAALAVGIRQLAKLNDPDYVPPAVAEKMKRVTDRLSDMSQRYYQLSEKIEKYQAERGV